VPHMDPYRLIVLALSEETEDRNESDHLTRCEGCRHEIRALRHVAGLGSQARELRKLPSPPEHVWQAIEARQRRLPGATRAGRPRPRRTPAN
jgi:hypothetical protein